ncbi:MAG: DUF4864 domain-containing protein [Pseudomonadota bacterium]
MGQRWKRDGRDRAGRRRGPSPLGGVGRLCARALALLLAAAPLATFAPNEGRGEPGPGRGNGPESRAIIERQLDAFQRDAWAEAYSFAAPEIRQVFPSAEIFADMVRGAYPMVWRPSGVDFLEDSAAGATEHRHLLRLIDADGEAHLALYELRLVNGAWRISGVRVMKEPAASA